MLMGRQVVRDSIVPTWTQTAPTKRRLRRLIQLKSDVAERTEENIDVLTDIHSRSSSLPSQSNKCHRTISQAERSWSVEKGNSRSATYPTREDIISGCGVNCISWNGESEDRLVTQQSNLHIPHNSVALHSQRELDRSQQRSEALPNSTNDTMPLSYSRKPSNVDETKINNMRYDEENGSGYQSLISEVTMLQSDLVWSEEQRKSVTRRMTSQARLIAQLKEKLLEEKKTQQSLGEKSNVAEKKFRVLESRLNTVVASVSRDLTDMVSPQNSIGIVSITHCIEDPVATLQPYIDCLRREMLSLRSANQLLETGHRNISNKADDSDREVSSLRSQLGEASRKTAQLRKELQSVRQIETLRSRREADMENANRKLRKDLDKTTSSQEKTLTSLRKSFHETLDSVNSDIEKKIASMTASYERNAAADCIQMKRNFEEKERKIKMNIEREIQAATDRVEAEWSARMTAALRQKDLEHEHNFAKAELEHSTRVMNETVHAQRDGMESSRLHSTLIDEVSRMSHKLSTIGRSQEEKSESHLKLHLVSQLGAVEAEHVRKLAEKDHEAMRAYSELECRSEREAAAWSAKLATKEAEIKEYTRQWERERIQLQKDIDAVSTTLRERCLEKEHELTRVTETLQAKIHEAEQRSHEEREGRRIAETSLATAEKELYTLRAAMDKAETVHASTLSSMTKALETERNDAKALAMRAQACERAEVECQRLRGDVATLQSTNSSHESNTIQLKHSAEREADALVRANVMVETTQRERDAAKDELATRTMAHEVRIRDFEERVSGLEARIHQLNERGLVHVAKEQAQETQLRRLIDELTEASRFGEELKKSLNEAETNHAKLKTRAKIAEERVIQLTSERADIANQLALTTAKAEQSQSALQTLRENERKDAQNRCDASIERERTIARDAIGEEVRKGEARENILKMELKESAEERDRTVESMSQAIASNKAEIRHLQDQLLDCRQQLSKAHTSNVGIATSMKKLRSAYQRII